MHACLMLMWLLVNISMTHQALKWQCELVLECPYILNQWESVKKNRKGGQLQSVLIPMSLHSSRPCLQRRWSFLICIRRYITFKTVKWMIHYLFSSMLVLNEWREWEGLTWDGKCGVFPLFLRFALLFIFVVFSGCEIYQAWLKTRPAYPLPFGYKTSKLN